MSSELGALAAAAGINTVNLSGLPKSLDLTGFNAAVAVNGTAGADAVTVDMADAGAKSLNLGASAKATAVDAVSVTPDGANAVRLTFASAEVGNGSATGADGGLNVRMQQEDANDALIGAEHRVEDENVVFSGAQFDVRNLADGAQRGTFQEVMLGSSAADSFTAATATGAVGSYINAGQGDDIINGGAGNDFLVGGAGNDKISTGAGNNSVLAGAGNDEITAGSGVDNLEGGDGDDTFNFATGTLTANKTDATLNDVIVGGAGVDRIAATAADFALIDNTAAGAVQSVSGIEGLVVTDAVANTNINTTKIQAGIAGVTLQDGASAGTGVITFGVASAGLKLGKASAASASINVATAGSGVADAITITNVATPTPAGTPSVLTAVNVFNGSAVVATDVELLCLDGSVAGAAAMLQTVGDITVTGTDLDGAGTGTATAATSVTFLGDESFSTGLIKATKVDASGLTGSASLTASTEALTTIGSAGADALTLQAATVAAVVDNPATTLNEAKAAINATASAGAGNDVIFIETTGDAATTVNGDAGNDDITVTSYGASVAVNGGEGNDIVRIGATVINTASAVDGGAGVDTVAVVGMTAARTDDDFIVLNSLFKNFETLQLTSTEGSATVSFDASKLATNYSTIDLASGSFVDNVGTQKLVANGNLTAEAAGFVASTTYAGSLNITAAAAAVVTANAASVALTVDASKAAVAATLSGASTSANVKLVQGVNPGTDATITTDDSLFAASVVVDNAAALADLASLTLSGNGSATVTNAALTDLVMVDASALNSVDISGAAAAGLSYTSANSLAETIKLGAGKDIVTLKASTYGAINAKTFDNVQGMNLVLNADGTLNTAVSDDISVFANAGATTALTGFKAFATTQTDLDLALKDAAASADASLVFQLGGDTYIFSDVGTGNLVDSADVLVKLTGAVNVDALVLALNA